MRRYLCLSLIVLMLGGCKKEYYHKEKPENFGDFRNNILFYNPAAGVDSVPLFDETLKFRINIKPVFPNVDYGNGVFKILSNSQRSVFFATDRITVLRKDYMEVVQTITPQNKIINAYPAFNGKFLLLCADSSFRLFDITKQEYFGNSLLLKNGDKMALTKGHLVVLEGKTLKRYWLQDLALHKSLDLSYTPGGFCLVDNNLYVVHSPSHLLQYPDIYKYNLDFTLISKTSAFTYAIGLDNLFPYAANANYLCFVFQGKLTVFNAADGQVVTPYNKMNLAINSSTFIEVLPEFESGLPVLRYFRNGQWYYGISSGNYYWQLTGTANRQSICIGDI